MDEYRDKEKTYDMGDDAMDVLVSKQSLRAQLKEKKAALSAEQVRTASDRLTQMFLEHPAYLACKTLYAYMSYNTEVRTDGIIRAALESGRTVAVPKVENGRMEFYKISSPEDTVPGFKGIPEPKCTDSPVDDSAALILVPGLAFDRRGRRMGYGGGFYDRYLSERPRKTVALCYSFQLFESIPSGEYDVPVDYVLSTEV